MKILGPDGLPTKEPVDRKTLIPHGEKKFFNAVVDISGPLQGTLKDWPAMIQDKLHIACTEYAKLFDCTYEIIGSRCDKDPDSGWYIHIAVSLERIKRH